MSINYRGYIRTNKLDYNSKRVCKLSGTCEVSRRIIDRSMARSRRKLTARARASRLISLQASAVEREERERENLGGLISQTNADD